VCFCRRKKKDKTYIQCHTSSWSCSQSEYDMYAILFSHHSLPNKHRTRSVTTFLFNLIYTTFPWTSNWYRVETQIKLIFNQMIRRSRNPTQIQISTKICFFFLWYPRNYYNTNRKPGKVQTSVNCVFGVTWSPVKCKEITKIQDRHIVLLDSKGL